MMYSLLILLYTSFSLCLAQSNIYNIKSNILLTGESDTFYGFSVHLQRGDPARIIIGAPKTEGNPGYFGGSVYDCDIQKPPNCKQYLVPVSRGCIGTNNFFGAAIDGGINRNNTVAISMPKYMKQDFENSYTVGAIFRLSDLEKNNFLKFPIIEEEYIDKYAYEYLFGFAEYGFSINAMNDTEFLYGAPGYGHWRGEAYYAFESEGAPVPEARRAAKKLQRSLIQRDKKIVNKQADASALAGYAVASGNFFGDTLFVIGMPNDNNYYGSVKLYAVDEWKLTLTSPVKQLGEYYGSALCAADINGDGYDDLLVGAPNYGKKDEFDNGRVYVYISDQSNGFKLHQTFIGPITSRFGTSITNLGKFTTSKSDAIAIGSPYEEGLGAVSIYIWSNAELTLNSKIMLKDTKAFGYSLSRGVDIDNNNAPDFAVGDYRKNTVTIIKARSLFKYDVNIKYPILKADEDVREISVTLCYLVEDIEQPIEANVTLNFDNRFDYDKVQYKKILIDKQYCEEFKLKFKEDIHKQKPLLIKLELKSMDCDNCPLASPMHSNIFERRIPFQYCSSAICTPKLILSSKFTERAVVVGPDTKIGVKMNIKNEGDSAFECQIAVETAPEMAIISSESKTKCMSFPCQRDLIRLEENINYELAFNNYMIDAKRLQVTTTVSCTNATTIEVQTLELRYETNLNVITSDLSLLYDSENQSTFLVNGELIYSIHNDGPSFLKEQKFTIMIPRYVNDEKVIEIYKPEIPNNSIIESTNGDVYDIVYEDDNVSNSSEVSPAGFVIAKDLPKTIKCEDDDVKCMTISGKVANLRKDERAKLVFSVLIHVRPILMKYERTFSIESTLSFDSTIYNAQINVVDRLTLTDSIWLYVLLGLVISCIIIAVIVLILKKFHFFTRPTREKLIEEQNEIHGTEMEITNHLYQETTQQPEKAADEK